MKNATLRQLRIFSEVARHLSFARTAETLHLTPPAISQQIKALEEHVGGPLFSREGKQVSLTAIGEHLLVHVRKILAQVKDAEDALLSLQKLRIGKLVIGMVSTAEYFVPRLVGTFGQAHPGLDIKLAVGNRSELTDMLADNDVDIAIMGRAPKDLPTRAEPFAAHPHVFIASPDHPVFQQPAATAESAFADGLIVREPSSGTRAALMDFLTSQDQHPKFVMEMHSNETIKQAVIACMGISFVSLHTIGLEIKNGLLKVLELPGSPVVRGWNVVSNHSKSLSPAAEAFRQFVLENGERMLSEQFGHL